MKLLAGRSGELRLEKDVYGKSCTQAPLIVVFRLKGQSWTQISGPIRGGLRALPLAQLLAAKLGTRALAAEVTDDAYQTAAFFDRGAPNQIFLYCALTDIQKTLTSLGQELRRENLSSEYEDEEAEDEYLEATYQLGWEGEPGDIAELAAKAGCYIHAVFAADSFSTYSLEGLDPADVERCDVFLAK
jgi:hypothetical protein